MCGEHHNRLPSSRSRDKYGSSPHVRGTRWRYPQSIGLGIVLTVHPRMCGEHHMVSARIGKISAVHPRMCGEHNLIGQVKREDVTSVHPRMCGEHRPLPVYAEQSPHVRGTLPSTVPNMGSGSSPHVRGTRLRWPCTVVHFMAGSSPHVRGTPTDKLLESQEVRFIPAQGTHFPTTR